MENLPVEVIVVAFGAVELLDSALKGLGSEFLVHVVDNGRSDEAEDIAQSHGADYTRPVTNLGFAAAVNIGLQRCKPGADVLLLNPDAVINPGGVRDLQSARDQAPSRVAATAPRLLRPDGSVEPTSWPMPTPTSPWRGALGRGSLRPDETYFLSGAVLLLSGPALVDVGQFDPRFFLYCEESDWQQRALRRGWSVLEVPSVTAEHLGAATSDDDDLRLTLFHGSAELFVRKWHGRWGWCTYRTGALVAALRRQLTARDKPSRSVATRTFILYVRGPASCLPAFARHGT